MSLNPRLPGRKAPSSAYATPMVNDMKALARRPVDAHAAMAESVETENRSEDRAQSSTNVVYTSKTARLAMDSTGNTGLDLRWDKEWGVLVMSVDPLPGQPDLSVGDYVIAIDG